MNKMTIKVSLNSNKPDEAELIKILQDIGNRSGHLKLAAMHYWNVTGRVKPGNTDGDITSINSNHNEQSMESGNKEHQYKPISILDKNNAFANTF